MSNDAPMHRNTVLYSNRTAFLLRQIESKCIRAIPPYRASSNKPFFGVVPRPRPRWTVVMCLVRLSIMAPCTLPARL